MHSLRLMVAQFKLARTRLKLAWTVRTQARYEAQIAALEGERRSHHKEIERTMYLTLGMITHMWAALEITLDMTNWAIATSWAEKERFPVSLGRKVRFFRDGHNRDPRLADLREGAASIADAITTASLRRHDLVHGIARGTMKDKTIVLYKHVVPKGSDQNHLLFSDEVRVERDDLFRLADTIGDTSARLHEHALLLITTLHPDAMKDAGG